MEYLNEKQENTRYARDGLTELDLERHSFDVTVNVQL
jgi:hypothetical protein